MTVEEAIAIVERLLKRGCLTRAQEIVFRYAWEGKTYLEMARAVTYDPGHIKDVGSELWRSLRHAPFFHDKVKEYIKIFSDQQVTILPACPYEQITCLIDYLRKYRCLLILDNFDTLLEQGKGTGCYREGYEPYGELLWRLG